MLLQKSLLWKAKTCNNLAQREPESGGMSCTHPTGKYSPCSNLPLHTVTLHSNPSICPPPSTTPCPLSPAPVPLFPLGWTRYVLISDCNSVTDIIHDTDQFDGWRAHRVCPQEHAGYTAIPVQAGHLWVDARSAKQATAFVHVKVRPMVLANKGMPKMVAMSMSCMYKPW